MKLAKIAGLFVPDTRHISFVINNVYRGVHLEVEPVDGDFFDRRDLGDGPFYKAVNHGARFAPPQYCEYFPYYYEPQSVTPSATDTLGARIAFMQFAHPDIIQSHLSDIVDITNLIKHFALMYCIKNTDGMTKNYFVYQGEDEKYILVPWDCDATFGNDWQGIYVGGANAMTIWTLTNQGIFQRLISVPEYHSAYEEEVDYLATIGFDSLSQIALDVWNEIRNDAYQDTFKIGSNEEFDEEFQVLIEFMNERGLALANLDWFHRIDAQRYSVYPVYISDLTDTVHFEIEVEASAYSCWLKLDDSLGCHSYSMNDLGINGDSLAGDLIFTLETDLTGLSPPIYYSFSTQANPNEAYLTPPAGNMQLMLYPVSLPVIQLNSNPPQMGEISIGPFWWESASHTSFVGLRNTTDRDIDLSGCIVKIGQGHRLLILRELSVLSPGDTLFISNHKELSPTLLPQAFSTGNLYFVPEVGDTVYLETSGEQYLSSAIVDTIMLIGEIQSNVVINEINYHCDEDFEAGDWVEIYVVSGTVNLHNWKLKDSRENHTFTIPLDIILEEGDYFVLANDTSDFRECFPEVTQVVGNWGFGFGAGGDIVRLFNSQNCLVDIVAFDDDNPWPEEPDGDGPSLELISPLLPNYNYENWEASEEPFAHGSPGMVNSNYNFVNDYFNSVLSGFSLLGVYPNPFNSNIHLKYRVDRPGRIQLTIYDVLGRSVRNLHSYFSTAGEKEIIWDGRNDQAEIVSSGIYFLDTEFYNQKSLRKVVLIR
jgi:hypothetical protein